MNIILLGPPGSGKGTQGALLAKKYNLKHLSTGDLFREILSNENHPLYPEVQVVKQGKLVSDEVVNKVVANGLQSIVEDGVIFDGYPRTTAQAEALDGILEEMGQSITAVIDLNVGKEVLLHRLLGRRICPKCKRVYHISQGIENCAECNEKLIQRADDNEETIMKRFEEYQKKTSPLKEYYRDTECKYIEVMIDTKDKSPDNIMDEIDSKF